MVLVGIGFEHLPSFLEPERASGERACGRHPCCKKNHQDPSTWSKMLAWSLIRLRYWSEMCTIHITIQSTIHFLRYISDTYTVHKRYKNHRNWLCIQSSIHTAQPPSKGSKPRFRIECVSTCIENAFATRGYTFDTRTIHRRYCTIQVMGKSHHDTWGNGVGIPH